MAQREVTLDTAAFLDSAPSRNFTLPRAQQKEIVERFLACCYDELGKAPRFLDGADVHEVVGHLLPAHFARKDPLAPQVAGVIASYFDFLEQSAVVAELFEMRQALAATAGEFEAAVRTGVMPHHGGPPPAPFVHKGTKVGRNDPCPCGSGKKFKQCCWKIGR
jgi:hypothetical protein